jgi:hypothetical protein
MGRRALLVVVLGACLAVPAVAHTQATGGTRSGTVLSVDPQQIITESNGDGTVTRCGVVAATFRDDAGDFRFATGGVLRPDDTLEPGVQAVVDTLREGARLGDAAVVTVTYEDAHMLCGRVGAFATAVSLKAVPTPTPRPTPTPGPVSKTSTGYISRMSPLGLAILGATGSCRLWPGIMKTDAGPSFQFAVQSPLVGDLATTGLVLADPHAFELATMLQRAGFFGARAPVTMTYTPGPVRVCTRPLDNVVTAATVRFPSPYETKKKFTRRGRVTQLSAPTVITGDGSSCRFWRGSFKPSIGRRFRFAVETPLTGSPPRPADRRAVKNATALRRARTKRTRRTVTFATPVIACGEQLKAAVTRVR